MTIKELIVEYTDKIKDISDTPRLDIEILLQKVLNVDRLFIHLNLNKKLTSEELEIFINLANERIEGRPIAYIINNREFMGLDFFVKEGVLIPRPDTEILVEEIISICNNKCDLNILDIGTGSGAITISLAKYIQGAKITSLDISNIAIEIAKINAKNNDVDDSIKFIKSDLFTSLKGSNVIYDIIVSNPPYIRKSDIEELHTQVKDFEPYNALEGGEDGLDFYRKITKESKDYIKNKGILAFEVGHDQASEVIHIMECNGYKDIYTRKDLQGIDRVVIGFNI